MLFQTEWERSYICSSNVCIKKLVIKSVLYSCNISLYISMFSLTNYSRSGSPAFLFTCSLQENRGEKSREPLVSVGGFPWWQSHLREMAFTEFQLLVVEPRTPPRSLKLSETLFACGDPQSLPHC